MATQADVRRIARSLPGAVEEDGHFAFWVQNKDKARRFAWVWRERVDPRKARVPQPKVIVIRVASLDDKEFLLGLDREKFFTEPHYNGDPAILVRLPAVTARELRPLITEAWRAVTGGTGGTGAEVNLPEASMDLGNFSVSLAVKDIEASKRFYEKLGFSVFHGDQTQNWLIMKNGGHVIGLFQGMFEKNILTFNPGWDSNAQKVEPYTDVRELQRRLKAEGVPMITEADEGSTGPASFVIADPDGNTILFDQHV